MSSPLPTWLERWLGLQPAGSGEGTLWSLDHHWPFPAWLTIVGLLGIVGLVAWCYSREPGGARRGLRATLAALRLLAIGLALVMLAEVALSLRRTGLPTVVLLVDDSASMSLADRYESSEQAAAQARVRAVQLDAATRLNLVKAALLEQDRALLEQLARRYRLKVYFVGEQARAQDGSLDELEVRLRALEPTGGASRLGAALRTVLNDMRGTPPAAVILASDGINTDGEPLREAARYAQTKGVQVFALAVGSASPDRDLEVSDLLVDDAVFVDDIVNFECKLSGAGYPGRRVDVVLRLADKPEPLARTTVTVPTDGAPQKVRVPYRPREVGEFEYVVEVAPLPDETRPENNRQSRVVSVRKEQVRVLLVQGYPSFEFRYLKQLLQRDATIELKTVLQEADLEYAEFDSTGLRVFPVRRDDLFEFDVIVFGDVNPSLLSASSLTHVRDFVLEKGGGVIFASGPRWNPSAYRDTPLAELFPVDLASAVAPAVGATTDDPFRVVPTDLGLASPPLQLGDTPEESLRIWQQLPELYWHVEAPRLRPGARVLAEHSSRLAADGRKLPIIALQYAGAGKTVFHATDETYRWRYRVGDVFMARYWVQMIRYLSRSKLLGKDRSAELAFDRREYRQGEPVRARVRFIDERQAPAADDGVTIVLEREGQPNRQVKLSRAPSGRGVFEATLPPLADGRYHAWVAEPALEGNAPAADFQIVAPPGEFERVATDRAELGLLARETSLRDDQSHVYGIHETARLLAELPEGRPVPIEALPPLGLWNHWLVQPLFLGLFLGLLVTEWIVRKWVGML